MLIKFSASEGVVIEVPREPVPIQHYLRQPRRLVSALVDPRRTEQLGENLFRLKMRPLRFIILNLQPTVDLQVQSNTEGHVHLESVGCEIRGVEYINQRFRLKLVGNLYPVQTGDQTSLQGKADLEVQVDVPPPLEIMPRAVLESTGNNLLSRVLSTIKQRLMHQLIVDYCHWAQATAEATSSSNSLAPELRPNPPIP